MANKLDVTDKISEADDDLIYFFKHFDTILASKGSSIENITTGVDFQVFSEYLIRDIGEIREKLSIADDKYLLQTCEHLYDIIEWMRLIVENRSEVFSDAFERVFDQEFGDKQILQNIYSTSLERWITGKSGQHRLGGNIYSVLDNELYYRDRFGVWYRVDKGTAFDLQPNRESFSNKDVIEQLNAEYKDTWYDAIIKSWDEQSYSGSIADDFSEFGKDETSPEEYFDFTLGNIKNLLKNPVSISELERWNGGKINNLEDTIKLCSMALDIVRDRREDNSHTVYLLRDCMVFNELHKTLDIFHSEETSSDQLMIGRKLLSHKPDQWGYYIVILEALYEAHKRYPDDFDEFYGELARLLDIFASVSPGFLNVVGDIATYIKEHIKTNKKKIVIFDVGFQGSINLFIKYVIDRHINISNHDGETETEIEVSVGALWSKELFKERARGFYFPFLNRFQYMARSDELYHYKFGSLKDGALRVAMGNKEWQKKAAVELVVLVMVTKLAEQGS